MKRQSLIIVMVAMFALFAAACSCDVQPSPTPGASPSMAPSPSIMPSPSAIPSNSPSNSPSSTDGMDGVIPDFSEGAVVKPEDVPDVVKAVKDRFSDAEITSITHANYMDKKVYKVILKTKDNAAEEIYVDANGKILEEEDGDKESPRP